jgi:HlyD family secretion protein
MYIGHAVGYLVLVQFSYGSGIKTVEGKQMVEVLVGENEVEAVEIEVGLMNDMYVEVLSGLEEGQLVVTGSTKDLMPSQSVPENGSILPVAN